MYDATMSHFHRVAGPCYDHIWTAALALNCTDIFLKYNGHRKSLDMFSYRDSDINDVVFECMGNTSCIGVTGKIMFDGGAEPAKDVYIERIQDGEREHVGLYNIDANPMHFQWIPNGMRWRGGNVPRDSTYITREEVLIPSLLYITTTSLASVGIMIAALLFTFNVKYKNNRVVKMSSPNINNLLLLGCVLCYSTVFIKTTGTSTATVCRTMKGYQLVAIILSLVGVVLVVLVAWEIVAPHTVITSTLYKEVYMTGNDAEIHPFIRSCDSEHSIYFGWALYIIEGAVLALGAFLAWETRHNVSVKYMNRLSKTESAMFIMDAFCDVKVKIEALNDSRQIGLCLYNVVILSVVGLTFSLLLNQHVVMLYGLTYACIIIGTTVTQIVVFMPKVCAVFKKISADVSTLDQDNSHPIPCSASNKIT